jgi:type II secretory pathway component PulF
MDSIVQESTMSLLQSARRWWQHIAQEREAATFFMSLSSLLVAGSAMPEAMATLREGASPELQAWLEEVSEGKEPSDRTFV